MKNYLALFVLLVFACKQKSNPVNDIDYSEVDLEVTTSIYPENMTKVFNAHGNLDQWNSFNTLIFTMKTPNGDEVTTTDLKDRRSLIEAENFKIGYTGTEAWLINKANQKYEGNPRFYYNLMFYFYAMPFILADDGILYTDVEPLKVGETLYPGIKISYGAGIGESPEDEYIVYYDAKTNRMAWLGYTVTYFTREKSTAWHFIKYANWQMVNGLLLPKTLEWYKADGFTIEEKRKTVLFKEIKLLKTKLENVVFAKPEVAVEQL